VQNIADFKWTQQVTRSEANKARSGNGQGMPVLSTGATQRAMPSKGKAPRNKSQRGTKSWSTDDERSTQKPSRSYHGARNGNGDDRALFQRRLCTERNKLWVNSSNEERRAMRTVQPAADTQREPKQRLAAFHANAGSAWSEKKRERTRGETRAKYRVVRT
jgi:hypothetical protein